MELWQFWTLAGVNFVSVLLASFSIYAFSAWRSNRKKRKLLESLFGQVLEKVETDIQFRDIVGNLKKDGNDE
jgi:hypothetical protein